jgi:uncharacterized protein YjbI with pentapeptide repeats
MGMNQIELKDIIKKHGKWLKNEYGCARADLSSANLRFANLQSADLHSANLRSIKLDFYEVLLTAIPEVAGLYDSLMRGKVDGSKYTGECACLVGTIANVRKVDVDTLKKNSNRPAEVWFLGIRKGDVPQSN